MPERLLSKDRSWVWAKGDPKVAAWRQEDTDLEIAGWGVHKPYVLFSRHINLKIIGEWSFPVPGLRRWNEMVIYPQVQESLIVVQRMTDEELAAAIKDPNAHIHYEKHMKNRSWNITVPGEAKLDFLGNLEFF
jgi:magnesium-dependent phosphatase 1